MATMFGVVAILLWSTTIAVSRHLAETMGTFTSGAAVYLLSGSLGCGILLASGKWANLLKRTPRKYLFGCGGLMVAYTVLLYGAVGFARGQDELVAVTAANYLWPGLTLALSVPLLHHRVRFPLLVAGGVAGLLGVALAACIPGADWAFRPGLPVLAALAAALAWGLYSNLSRRWAAEAQGAVPLFILASGFALLAIRWLVAEKSTWNSRCMLETGFMAVFPTLLAYTFWDLAVRRGNLILVSSLSYFTPLLSVGVSGLYLGLPLRASHWLAAVLVLAAAVLCKLAVRDNAPG